MSPAVIYAQDVLSGPRNETFWHENKMSARKITQPPVEETWKVEFAEVICPSKAFDVESQLWIPSKFYAGFPISRN